MTNIRISLRPQQRLTDVYLAGRNRYGSGRASAAYVLPWWPTCATVIGLGNIRMLVLGITDGISCGAAILRDGVIEAAVNEERLSRLKMAYGFPRQSITE